MGNDEHLPLISGSSDLPQGLVRNLSLALSVILNVYNKSNSYRYIVNGRHLDYNVDGGKIYEFSHLLYNLSQTEAGKAAIADIRDNSVPEMREKLEETLQHGKEKTTSEIRISGSSDLAVNCIAHAIMGIVEIKEKMIIGQEHLDAIVSVLGETENGKKALEELQEMGIPSDTVSTAYSIKKFRTR